MCPFIHNGCLLAYSTGSHRLFEHSQVSAKSCVLEKLKSCKKKQLSKDKLKINLRNVSRRRRSQKTHLSCTRQKWSIWAKGNGIIRQSGSAENSNVKTSGYFPEWIWKAQNVWMLVLTWERSLHFLNQTLNKHSLNTTFWVSIQSSVDRVAQRQGEVTLILASLLHAFHSVLISQLSLHVPKWFCSTREGSWREKSTCLCTRFQHSLHHVYNLEVQGAEIVLSSVISKYLVWLGHHFPPKNDTYLCMSVSTVNMEHE